MINNKLGKIRTPNTIDKSPYEKLNNLLDKELGHEHLIETSLQIKGFSISLT